jgi:hypothetical protein
MGPHRLSWTMNKEDFSIPSTGNKQQIGKKRLMNTVLLFLFYGALMLLIYCAQTIQRIISMARPAFSVSNPFDHGSLVKR